MKTRYVIKNIPTKLPVQSTVLWYLVLDYYKASDIWYGVYFTLYALAWLGSIIVIWKQESIDINEFSAEGQSNYLKFKRSLIDLIKERQKK